ncbi:MAG: hypothetical protein IJK46_10960 [Prevotella sp.]|nr:hypothetical protein [Prevotella sp.]
MQKKECKSARHSHGRVDSYNFCIVLDLDLREKQCTFAVELRQYGFDRAEVESWVQDLHFNWPLSVKALLH